LPTETADVVRLKGEAREVVLAEAQAVRGMAVEQGMRDRLAGLIAAADDGELDEENAEVAESVLELGLTSGRIRALYGPGGEQAVLKTIRRLPRGRAPDESAREVSSALAALNGRPLDGVRIAAVGPGAYTITVEADGVDVSIRLDGTGARVTTVGT
jgi:hypothetical protein